MGSSCTDVLKPLATMHHPNFNHLMQPAQRQEGVVDRPVTCMVHSLGTLRFYNKFETFTCDGPEQVF